LTVCQAFARGTGSLLEAIDRPGSINQASKEINFSYRKARAYIKALEERPGFKLTDRQTGGQNRGGATLTDDARRFLKKYAAIETGVQELFDDKAWIIQRPRL